MTLVALAILGGCARGESTSHTDTTVVVTAEPAAPTPATAASPTSATARPASAAHAAAASPAVAPLAGSPTATDVALNSATAPTATPIARGTAPSPPTAASTGPDATASNATLALGAPGATPPAATQILSVRTSPSVVHAGESVSWDVRTTPDIVTLTAHVSAYTIPLQRTAPGRFALNFAVPTNVPAMFHGTYNLDLTGQTSAGATAKRTVSMTFQ